MIQKGLQSISSTIYSDPDVLQSEQGILFKEKFLYLGSFSNLNSGEFKLIQSLGKEKILSFPDHGPVLLDNSCTHRRARIIQSDQNQLQIRCPIHHWTFGQDGGCTSVPMAPGSDKSGLDLKKTNVYQFGDLLFAGEQGKKVVDALSTIPSFEALGLNKMVHRSRDSEIIQCNWKNYIEIFAENYHVPFVHPGFSKIVDLKKLDWIQNPAYCLQIFKMNSDFEKMTRSTTPEYKNWLNALNKYFMGNFPSVFGSLVLFYPNLIIETYPLTTAVGWIEPMGVHQFKYTVDYYHDIEMLKRAPEIAELAKLALDQTEEEDKAIAKDLSQGRLNDTSTVDQPIYVGNLEVGVQAFYQYYQDRMKDKLPKAS